MKDSIKRKLKSAGYAVGTAMMSAAPFMVMPLAADTGTAETVIGEFLAYILDMFFTIGIMLGVWAIAQLALSFKNEDADSKSRAMMMLVVAVMLIAVDQLAQPIFDAAGFDITLGGGLYG